MQLEARRIFHQHEQLDALYDETVDAIADAQPETARAALGRLRDGLLAHFEVEESTHFPALHGLSSASAERLVQRIPEHVGFREQLGRLEAARDRPEGAARAELAARGRGLAAHEKLEEELFAAATGGAPRG